MTTFWADPNDPYIVAKEFGFYVLVLVVLIAVVGAGFACCLLPWGRMRKGGKRSEENLDLGVAV